MKEVCKYGLFIISLLFLNTCVIAQQEYNKVFEKSFSGIKTIEVNHRRGPIEVFPSSNGQVSYKVELTFKARAEEDAQTLISHFQIDADQSGSRLNISSDLNIREWNSRNGNVRIKFSDGDRASDIKDVKVKMLLYVPALDFLELKNKYDNIVIEQALNAELSVDLYSGRLKVQQVNKDLNLSMKYSKALVGNFQNGKIKIYDSDIILGDGAQVELESKYSDIELGNLQSLSANTYDDKMKVKNIKGDLRIEDKYTEFEILGAANVFLNLYDAEFEIGSGKNFQVKSKYTTFRLGAVDNLDFELSYDDKVRVKELNGFSAIESKYTEYDFQKLNKSIKLNSHNDKLNVDLVTGTFSGLTFQGKYTDINLSLEPSVLFRLDYYSKYGRINVDEDRFEANIYKEKSSELELKGAMKGAESSSPLVKINAYDCKVSIQ